VIFKSKGEARGAVLLGAASRQELERLGERLLADPDSVCGDDRSAHCTVFPEACSVSLEMQIIVNGAPRTVLWGSLLLSVAAHPSHVQLLRLHRERLTPVEVDPADPNDLRLPLLPGDRVSWE